MRAENTRLIDFLGQSITLLKIPVYQRNYEWKEIQCRKLFDDLTQAAITKQRHFLGTIVYTEEPTSNMGHIDTIIDGQQRLISCTLLLKALTDDDELLQGQAEDFLTNKHLEINRHLKIQPVEHDVEAFQCVMENRLNEYGQASKVVENFNLFKRLIDSSALSAKELFEAMQYFDVVRIQLDRRDENPQLVFESLNSTGMSLTAADLVRNFILLPLGSYDQERLYKQYWTKIERMLSPKIFDDFLRRYLIYKTRKIVNISKIYPTYKVYYADKQFDPETALNELYLNAQYYNQLLNASTSSPRFNQIIKRINVLDQRVVYAYFMQLLTLRDQGRLNWPTIAEIAEIIENVLFRRMICEVANSGLMGIMVTLINALDNVEPGKEIIDLKKRLRNNDVPDDRAFRNGVLNTPIYKKRGDWAKLALILIEKHQNKETISFDDAQVEHVMPQRLTNDWKIQVPNALGVNRQYGDTLGNLTLTKYNQEMSNKTFYEKRIYYAKSNVAITRAIANEYSKWDRETIINRAHNLADELIKIYPRPVLTGTELAEDYSGEYEITEKIDVTGAKPSFITIQSENIPVASWNDMLVKFLNYIWDNDSRTYLQIQADPQINKVLFKKTENPKELINGDEIETHFSANAIVALIDKMAEICGIEDEVSFTIK